MFPQVWQRVVSGHYLNTAATLAGYARFALKDDTYPGMVAAQDQMVTGIVYRDVGTADLHALDMFEGSEYRRCSVQVDTGVSGKILAETYLFLPQHRLSNQPWNPETFALDRFLSNYCP